MVVSGFKHVSEFVACFHPVEAFLTVSGEVVFAERRGKESVRTLSLPCGQCVGCRLERSRQWAIRCMHEVASSDANCFVTLTYRDEELPPHRSLRYADFQLFLRYLRRRHRGVRIRFFCAGEYSEFPELRPHYHALLFGFDFADRVPLMKRGEHQLFRSAELESLWPHGYSSVGSVTFQSAQYVAKYCLKKVTGQLAEAHYGVRVPEFARMSLRPGVGAEWFDKWWRTDYQDGLVLVDGKMVKGPRYYANRLRAVDVDRFERMQFDGETERRARAWDNTDERLAVREKVVRGRLNLGRT